MRLRLTGPLLCAALLCAVPAAAAGIVRGQLWLSKSAAREATRTAGKTAKAQSGIRDAVVYLERVPAAVERKLTNRGWFAKPLPLPRIVQKQLRFSPRVLATVAGDAVVFENADRVYHTTFSVSAARRFDLGHYAPGFVDTLTFDRAGVANLHCDIHPDEIGYVVVTPNHAIARPDTAGRFEFRKLAPGRYTAHVWHPRLGDKRVDFELPKRGDLGLQITY